MNVPELPTRPHPPVAQVAVASIVVSAMPDYCAGMAADGVQQSQFAWLARAQGSLSTLVMAATSGRSVVQ